MGKTASIYCGDVITVLKEFRAKSIQAVVTSPPYFGLRDYGIEGQIGTEATPAEYVVKMVEVFDALHRVLRDDGTVWLNIGDAYHKKQLGLIPSRLAIALQDAGWWVRADCIWSKPNPMPESVKDRPTRSHEYIFMLTKNPSYYFDQEAVRQPHKKDGRKKTTVKAGEGSIQHRDGERWPGSGANIRTVWEIVPKPFKGAHFAVFPPELVERCIKASTSEYGHCAECEAGWVRDIERIDLGWDGSKYGERVVEASGGAITGGTARSTLGSSNGKLTGKTITTGWRPSCSCGTDNIVPAIVLDPFLGSGTTLIVSRDLGRAGVGIDLKPEYCEMAAGRLRA